MVPTLFCSPHNLLLDMSEDDEKMWLPLESTPELMNQYATRLGLLSPFGFLVPCGRAVPGPPMLQTHGVCFMIGVMCETLRTCMEPMLSC